MASKEHTKTLEILLSRVSQEVDISHLVADIEEEEEHGETTEPNHGPAERVSL